MIDPNVNAVHTLVTPQAKKEDNFEVSLRPRNLQEYIGQEGIKSNLRVYIEAAKKRQEALEHMLFYGPPGLGKTTLANIIAHEMGVNIKITSGPAIEKQGDLASIITNLQENDILFIDEIHRLKTVVEEILYSAMEDYSLDLIIGKGPAARSMRLSLPRFTLIGATTKISLLSAPLRDRFGNIEKLNFYNEEDIQQILIRSAHLLKTALSPEAAHLIARSARATPRIANRLLKRVRDFAEIENSGKIDQPLAERALQLLGVDSHGLDPSDRELLRVLIEKFEGGPVGLNTLAAATSEEEETIEEVYEPYLIQLGFLDRTPRGRVATKKAYHHLGISWVEKMDRQSQLFG